QLPLADDRRLAGAMADDVAIADLALDDIALAFEKVFDRLVEIGFRQEQPIFPAPFAHGRPSPTGYCAALSPTTVIYVRHSRLCGIPLRRLARSDVQPAL